MKDPETKLLYVNLQLIRPYIITYPDSLSYELSGRLSKYIGKYSNITKLVRECDSLANQHCPLIPLSTCFETATLGFTQNITFRKIEPWHQGGTFTCTHDFKTMYVIDYNEEGLPVLLTWDIATGEKVNQININKQRNKLVTDLYFEVYVVNSGKWLLACYKERMDDTYGKVVQPGTGYIDCIDMTTGDVIRTYDTMLYRDEFFDPVVYVTHNYVCYSVGWKFPIVNYVTDDKQNYNRPTLLSHDEKYFILCGKDNIVLREHQSKQTIGVFDMNEAPAAVTASQDFRTIAMIGRETNHIRVYDLINKKLEAKETHQMIKTRHIFKLDDKTNSEMTVVFKPILETKDDGRVVEKTNNSVIMRLSHNAQHLMVVFVGWKWMAFLWTIWSPGRNISRFVGAITPFRMPCSYRIPSFNFDGSALVYAKKRKVIVVSTSNVQVINEYEMKEDIKDMTVSEITNKVAVMLQKSIMLLDVTSESQGQVKEKHKAGDMTVEILLNREIVKGLACKEVICKVWDDYINTQQVCLHAVFCLI